MIVIHKKNKEKFDDNKRVTGDKEPYIEEGHTIYWPKEKDKHLVGSCHVCFHSVRFLWMLSGILKIWEINECKVYQCLRVCCHTTNWFLSHGRQTFIMTPHCSTKWFVTMIKKMIAPRCIKQQSIIWSVVGLKLCSSVWLTGDKIISYLIY